MTNLMSHLVAMRDESGLMFARRFRYVWLFVGCIYILEALLDLWPPVDLRAYFQNMGIGFPQVLLYAALKALK